jgi:hypothetical protein
MTLREVESEVGMVETAATRDNVENVPRMTPTSILPSRVNNGEKDGC